MKTVLICGIIAAGLLEISGWQDYKQTTRWTTEVTTESDFTTPITYEEPTTTFVPFINYNKPYEPHQSYWSSYYGFPFEAHKPCSHEITDAVFSGYRNSIYNISAPLFRKFAIVTDDHFVFSPQTTFVTLAAIAEGTTGPAREELSKFLSLPEDLCLRESYYHLATYREQKGSDIVFARNRLLVADSSIHVNEKWKDYVMKYTNLNTVSVPYKTNPNVEIESLKRLFNVQLPHLNLNGNSLILESLDFSALWTSVFSDAVVEEGAFYDTFGEQIGVVEYMKVTKHVNIGIMPSYDLKIIDLPVGREGKYSMYFAFPLTQNVNYYELLHKIENATVLEVVAELKQSLEPVEIVIPKINITSEIDMRKLLEDIGIKSLWTDPYATRNISEPAALPSAFTQRVSLHLDDGGVRPAIQEYKNFVPPLHQFYSSGYVKPPQWAQYDPLELSSFIANKPFMFGLFDTQTYTEHLFGSYSKVLQ